jgi:hypothetical protein
MSELIEKLDSTFAQWECETVEMSQSVIDWIIENNLSYNEGGTLSN